jgi:putative ABC transport system permease protein
VTLAQARGDMAAVTTRLEREYPGTNRDVQLVPLKEKVVGSIQTPLIVRMVAVGFVLLIACSNVAHMLLARAATRERELAIRTALGATRSRIVSQLLVESALLALAGGAAGLALAVGGAHALVAASPAMIPRVATVTIDWHIVGAALCVTALTAMIFGLLPSLQASHVGLADTLRDGDRSGSDGRSRGRTRSLLVASEFALALVLLVGAGLMIRAFVALEGIDPGFDPHNVLTMIVSPARLPSGAPSSDQTFYTDALTQVQAVPGVASASYINHLPIAGDEWRLSFRVEGRARPRPGDSPSATYRVVYPGYFTTMRIPIRSGRDVAQSDRLDAPAVVVINEFMAHRYWPGENAVGKRITMDDSTWITVVGVVKNDVRQTLSEPPREEMFLPSYQRRASSMTLVVRAACVQAACTGAASALAQPVRRAIRSVERNAPISEVQTMRSVVASATADQRFYLVLLVAFASIAIVLAAVGIYGVISYSVSRRMHELGIRIALGASPSSVVRAVVKRGVALAAAGAAAGLVMALGLTGMMRNILYGVSPTDLLTYAAVTSLLLAVAIVASLVPARRATHIDPMKALRAD